MSTTLPNIDIDSHYTLSEAQIKSFRRDGFIKLKDVLSPETIAHYKEEITRLVQESSASRKPLGERDTYGKAFLQVTNIWPRSQIVEEFIRSKRLARIATELLGTQGVRLYHDQALYKESGGGFTPWHTDQVYWPLSNHNTVTAWIPLQAIPMEMGPLEFSVGSQNIQFGRDMMISDESERVIDEHLKRSDLPVNSSPFDLGEISFHYGYTFHRAGPNTTGTAREVMTIIYMDSDMVFAQPKSRAQERDGETWLKGCTIGQKINGPLNPVLYEHA